MEITVNLKDVEDCVESLNSNKKYLIIKNNFFSMDKIITLKAPRVNDESLFTNTSFELSYDDCCNKDVIKIIYMHEDTDCVTFVDTCQLISDSERNQLWDHAMEIANEKRKELPFSGGSLLLNKKEVDNIFYNEVLVYISSKINENDKSNLKDDFISKFELFKEKKQAIIKKTTDAINILYNKIIGIKLSEE